MADLVLVASQKSAAVDSIESFYTSPSSGNGTMITSFTAANNTTSNKSYKGYIYTAAGVSLDAVIPLRAIVRDKFDAGASIVGQLIPPGGSLRFESDAIGGISWRVTGREI